MNHHHHHRQAPPQPHQIHQERKGKAVRQQPELQESIWLFSWTSYLLVSSPWLVCSLALNLILLQIVLIHRTCKYNTNTEGRKSATKGIIKRDCCEDKAGSKSKFSVINTYQVKYILNRTNIYNKQFISLDNLNLAFVSNTTIKLMTDKGSSNHITSQQFIYFWIRNEKLTIRNLYKWEAKDNSIP